MAKKKITSRTCRFCDEIITAPSEEFRSVYMKHEWNKHQPKMLAQTEKAHQAAVKKREEEQRKAEKKQRLSETNQSDSEKSEKGKGDGDGYKAASTPEQANVFIIRPQRYEISSLYILIAKHICENEWKWPEMSVSEWLDTFLFHAMRQRGWMIGAYQKIGRESYGPG